MKRFLRDILTPTSAGEYGRAEWTLHWLLAAAIALPLAIFAAAGTISYHEHQIEARDRQCVVPACHVRTGLEVDHVDGWAATRRTKLSGLALLCHFHHHQKTYEGYRLEGEPGRWRWIPPPQAHAPPDGDDHESDPDLDTAIARLEQALREPSR